MDKAAYLTKLVMTYEMPLLRYARRLSRDREDARDAVQEAFIRFARDTGREIVNPAAWLYRTTRNLCFDQAKKKRRSMEITLDEAVDRDGPPDDRNAPDRVVAAGDAAALVRRHINGLAPRAREVVVLKLEHEKSYREIAEITGLSVSNVGFILCQAMKRLAAALEELR